MYVLGGISLLSGTMELWIKVMEWFQLVSQMKYLNANLAPNLMTFLQVFDFSRAMALPNFIHLPIPDSLQVAPDSFNNQGY